MAHGLDGKFSQMAFVGQTPWHGLGVKVDEDCTPTEFMQACGCDWEVDMAPLQVPQGSIEIQKTVSEEIDGVMVDRQILSPLPAMTVPNRAVYRKDNGSILGVVGPRYTPLQNVHAFDWFAPFIESGECSFHTGGALFDGQKIWALAQINRESSEIVKGDSVAKFLMLSNSHDGTTAIRVGFTPIRIVCANTLAMAHGNSASKLIRIRHTAKSKTSLDNIREIINTANSEFEATAEQYRLLASRQFNQADVLKYVKQVLEIKEDATSKKGVTQAQNRIDEMMTLIEGPRQNLPGVRGTWWAAYNGVNEFFNYKAGNTNSSRLDNLWFGTTAGKNADALKLALEMAA